MTKLHSKPKNHGPVPHEILTDRGVMLERAHLAQHDSNIHYGQSVVVNQDGAGNDIAVKIGQKCPVCQKRVRGLNHIEGDHHKGISPGNKRRYG